MERPGAWPIHGLVTTYEQDDGQRGSRHLTERNGPTAGACAGDLRPPRRRDPVRRRHVRQVRERRCRRPGGVADQGRSRADPRRERGDPLDVADRSGAGARGGRSRARAGEHAVPGPPGRRPVLDRRATAGRRSHPSCWARSTPTWSSPSAPTASPDIRTTWPSGQRSRAACYELRATRPVRLFHCHLPRSRLLLRDRLAEWVVELTNRFTGTQDFVRALTVFSRETTALGYAADFVRVDWFPSGSYLLEQGEPATAMYFLLSGQVEIRREGEDGRVRGGRPVGARRVRRRGGHRHRPARATRTSWRWTTSRA